MQSGITYIDGEPFFPIGMYSSLQEPSFRFSYRELQEAGFNLVSIPPERRVLDEIADAGLFGCVYGGELLDISNDTEHRVALIRSTVTALGDHPAMLVWESINEPSWTYYDYTKPRVSADGLFRGHRLLKRLDPNHVILSTHAPHQLVATLRHYSRGADAISTAMYPIIRRTLGSGYGRDAYNFHGDLKNQGPSAVGDYTTKTRRIAGARRAVWTTLQAFPWDIGVSNEGIIPKHMRWPSALELRCMAYCSIVRGANGLLFWGGQHLPGRTPFWTDLCNITDELRAYSSLFLSRRLASACRVTYREMGYSDESCVESMFCADRSRVYMFAVNTSLYPARTVFSGLPNIASSTRIKVEREARTLSAARGCFEDTFDGLAAHVYSWPRDARS